MSLREMFFDIEQPAGRVRAIYLWGTLILSLAFITALIHWILAEEPASISYTFPFWSMVIAAVLLIVLCFIKAGEIIQGRYEEEIPRRRYIDRQMPVSPIEQFSTSQKVLPPPKSVGEGQQKKEDEPDEEDLWDTIIRTYNGGKENPHLADTRYWDDLLKLTNPFRHLPIIKKLRSDCLSERKKASQREQNRNSPSPTVELEVTNSPRQGDGTV